MVGMSQNVRSPPGRLKKLSLVWARTEKCSQSDVLKNYSRYSSKILAVRLKAQFYRVGQAFSGSAKFSGRVTGCGGSVFFSESVI
jgi:hypothetical protein